MIADANGLQGCTIHGDGERENLPAKYLLLGGV